MADPPSKVWGELSLDFFGPLPYGDYLMVVIDDLSRFPVVEIIEVIRSEVVIPKLDAIFLCSESCQ